MVQSGGPYLKENWSEQFCADWLALPQPIREQAGDMFEIRWYGYSDLRWELEHNLLGTKAKADEFMKLVNALTLHQRSLIYFAYEA
jgi:hypothetical protein